MDKVKVHYAKLLQKSSNQIAKHHHQAGNTSRNIPTQNELLESLNTPGWALPKRASVRFSLKQKNFLYNEFMTGETTGKKQTPESTAKRMRSLRDDNNNKMFVPSEYLSKEQITSMFSRMTRNLKLGKLSPPEEQCDEVILFEGQFDDSPDDHVTNAMERVKDHFTITTNNFVCISFVNEKKKTFRGEHFVGQVKTVDD